MPISNNFSNNIVIFLYVHCFHYRYEPNRKLMFFLLSSPSSSFENFHVGFTDDLRLVPFILDTCGNLYV